MNRPQYGDYWKYPPTFDYNSYSHDLEDYCNELEKSNTSLASSLEVSQKTVQLWKEDCWRYEKALNKACEMLAMNEESIALDSSYHDKEQWKEWCLKDEK